MQPRPFWNPYIAGVALGLVLLASFVIMGFGLGSSGAVTRFGVGIADLIAPATVEANAYFQHYVGQGVHEPMLTEPLTFCSPFGSVRSRSSSTPPT